MKAFIADSFRASLEIELGCPQNLGNMPCESPELTVNNCFQEYETEKLTMFVVGGAGFVLLRSRAGSGKEKDERTTILDWK